MEYKKQEVEKLYMDLLAAFDKGPQSVVSYFSEDAEILYPYADLPVMNRQEYFEQLSGMLPFMIPFNNLGHRLYATDEPGTYWATLDIECSTPSTCKKYHQQYVVRFCVNKDMKINRYFEYWNPLRFIKRICRLN